MEEKRTNPAELTVEEINVYTVDCGNTRYRCMHDCIMTKDIYMLMVQNFKISRFKKFEKQLYMYHKKIFCLLQVLEKI